MNDMLWLVKVIGILFVAWVITGGAEKFQQQMTLENKSQAANSQSVRQIPKSYHQTIIVQ